MRERNVLGYFKIQYKHIKYHFIQTKDKYIAKFVKKIINKKHADYFLFTNQLRNWPKNYAIGYKDDFNGIVDTFFTWTP